MKLKILYVTVALILVWIGYNSGLDAIQGSCHSKECWQRVREAQAWDLCTKRHGARYCTYRNRFDRQPKFWRNYATAVFGCEGGVPYNKDGSAFIFRAEWTRSTALSAGLPLHRIPTYHEEALAVIRWTKIVGFHTTAGWPNCP